MNSIDRVLNSAQRHRQAISAIAVVLWAVYPLVAFGGFYSGTTTLATSVLLGMLWLQATVGYIALHVSNRWDTESHDSE